MLNKTYLPKCILLVLDSLIVFIPSLIYNMKGKEAHLNSKWCNVLSLVNVVVQAGGEGEEAVGGDEQLRHQVSVERKWEEWTDTQGSYHCIGQVWNRKESIIKCWRCAECVVIGVRIAQFHLCDIASLGVDGATHQKLLSS